MFMQELPEPEKVISSDQLVLFVRRWCPSNLELQPFQEVLLDGSTVEELKTKVGCSISVKVSDSQWYLLYPRAHCLQFCVFSE
jgi:ubiquitin carboxyl-terminal hydrolase 47